MFVVWSRKSKSTYLSSTVNEDQQLSKARARIASVRSLAKLDETAWAPSDVGRNSGTITSVKNNASVRRKGPEISRALGFGGVAVCANCFHSLEAKISGEGGLLLAFGVVDLSEGIVKCSDCFLEVWDYGEASCSGGGNHVFVKHVKHAASLKVHRADIVIEKDSLARGALVGLEDAHLVEERCIFGSRKAADSLNTAVNAPDSAVREHFLVGRVVIVAIEHDLGDVCANEVSCDFLRCVTTL